MNVPTKALNRMDSDIKKFLPQPWKELAPVTKLTVVIVFLLLILIFINLHPFLQGMLVAWGMWRYLRKGNRNAGNR